MGDANEIDYGAYRYRFACGGLRGGTAYADADAFSYGDARAADRHPSPTATPQPTATPAPPRLQPTPTFAPPSHNTAVGPAGIGYGYAGSGVSARSGTSRWT